MTGVGKKGFMRNINLSIILITVFALLLVAIFKLLGNAGTGLGEDDIGPLREANSNNSRNFQFIDLPASAPTIYRDARMLHQYRGVCGNCHIVMPDVAISRTARMPHDYRGVCSNCHTIVNQEPRAGSPFIRPGTGQ